VIGDKRIDVKMLKGGAVSVSEVSFALQNLSVLSPYNFSRNIRGPLYVKSEEVPASDSCTQKSFSNPDF
jgi:hypothetical protein